MRSAIIILLINYCAFLFSQNSPEIRYSRDYPAIKNNVPLHVINNHPNFFYLLRYNKPAHEFVIERRSKPDARMLSFTPLKMDSVNANWFDYENLDYLLYECCNKLYFVFEKVLNTKRAVYLKVIDTTGHSSGFKELAILDRDQETSDFSFEMKMTGRNKLLLVGKQFYYNGTSKKVALLYDLEKNDNVWVKKLPLENEFTGFSESFECNEHNDLYYVLGYRSILGYKRKYMNNGQLSVPVISYDSLFIYCMPAETRTNSRRKIDLRDSTGIKSISLIPSGSFINAIIHGNHYNEADEGRVFFLFQKFDRNLENGSVAKAVSLNDALVQKLTFYDGSDYKAAADKDYNRSGIYLNNDQAFILAGREEGTYSKELMLWTVNLQSGDFLSQQVVPRKIFFMPGNARYKHIGEVAGMIYKDQFFSFLLENRNNRNISAQEFRFQKFSRQRSIYGGNLAAYILKKDGNFEKKEIYRSLAYSFVPVKYQGTQGDFIFYLTNKGKKESFAILSLDLF